MFFLKLPDVSELLGKVTALIDGNIQEEVKEGQKVFDNIKQSIENSVNEQIPKLKKAIENAGIYIIIVIVDVNMHAFKIKINLRVYCKIETLTCFQVLLL